MKICIDPGHGGTDPGAIGQMGTKEKDVVLEISLLLAQYLRENGHRVLMTRYTEIPFGKLSVKERARTSNNMGANLFVSIHANADGDLDNNTGRGIETYCYRKPSKGYDVAKMVQDYLIKDTKLRDRGVKVNTTFYVLKHTNAPAILVEVGFINNIEEEKKLKDEYFQDLVAQSISDAICDWSEEIVSKN